MAIFFIFLALQVFDAATTLIFLARGVPEGNPLIGAMLHASAHPAMSLMVVKAAACCLAWFTWRSRRLTLLRRANVFFALCVVWNLTAILVGQASRLPAPRSAARFESPVPPRHRI
jgi:hypothetical protein